MLTKIVFFFFLITGDSAGGVLELSASPFVVPTASVSVVPFATIFEVSTEEPEYTVAGIVIDVDRLNVSDS